ncbi:MAG TPA: efflux RND transporter periplasmic adaptor subunit [Steroidobacteraceae bacterium]|nr:efflux RND transporter periplasmic adaptor subunit [Steroidobacteraceae bacterium]
MLQLDETTKRDSVLPHLRESQPVSSHRLRRVGLVALAIALVIALAGILVRHIDERQVARWTDAQAIPTVSVLQPQQGIAGRQTVLPGDIQAWYEAPIYARVNGYLKKWYFDYGAHVKKGTVLADIDAPDLDAELAAAQANLKAAQSQVNVREAQMQFAHTTYERWRDSPKGVVSEQERDAKKADYESAQAEYNAALANVNSDRGLVDRLAAFEQYKHIVAPFDGIVTARTTDIGDLISAGGGSGGGGGGGAAAGGAGGGGTTQLFRVADVEQMRVFVQVPQTMSAGIHAGLVAELHVPQYPDRVFKAEVATTANAINPSARTLLVELHAPNPDGLLQPGTYAEVHLELPGNPSVVRIPTSALIFRQDGLQVAVVDAHDRAQLRHVTLGRDLGTDVEVLSGISPKDRVIESPPDSIASGDPVRIAAN